MMFCNNTSGSNNIKYSIEMEMMTLKTHQSSQIHVKVNNSAHDIGLLQSGAKESKAAALIFFFYNLLWVLTDNQFTSLISLFSLTLFFFLLTFFFQFQCMYVVLRILKEEKHGGVSNAGDKNEGHITAFKGFMFIFSNSYLCRDANLASCLLVIKGSTDDL